jgi:hypothetical protein
MRGRGVAGELRIDWRQLIAFKRGFTDSVAAKQERRYADKGRRGDQPLRSGDPPRADGIGSEDDDVRIPDWRI